MVPITLMKHYDQNQHGEERVYPNLQFNIMRETQGKNSKQEVEAEIAAEAVEKGGLTH